MKPQYCAIIGDINKSRQLERRGAVQKKFEKAVALLNKEFKKEIASKFLITIGDEFQGLLHSAAKSYEIVRHFQDVMEPVAFSFGIGIGTLATPLAPKAALGMDGECFHRARAALQRAKKEKKKLCYEFDDPAVVLVNALVSSLDKQWEILNDTQRSILRLREKNLSQFAIAKKLGITKQAVSKAIASAALKEMEQANAALNVFLQQSSKKWQSTI